MQMLLQKITAIHQHYRKDRLTGSMYVYLAASFRFLSVADLTECLGFFFFSAELAYNDEQIHKFEK